MGGVSYVTTHDAAVAMYNKATPWRGEDPEGERPLPDKRSRDYGVRMDGTDVVFRYHRTDVVRWHRGGSYTLDTGGYRTRSTGEFASNFMPQRHWLQKEASHLRIGDQIYPIAGHKVAVSADDVPSGEGLGEFVKRTVNRKKSKVLLENLGYPAYREWYNTMFPMVRDSMPPTWHRKYAPASYIEAALKDPEQWHELMMSQSGTPAQVREAMYRVHGDYQDVWDYDRREHLRSTYGYEVRGKE
jgi:hypothetical protein